MHLTLFWVMVVSLAPVPLTFPALAELLFCITRGWLRDSWEEVVMQTSKQEMGGWWFHWLALGMKEGRPQLYICSSFSR